MNLIANLKFGLLLGQNLPQITITQSSVCFPLTSVSQTLQKREFFFVSGLSPFLLPNCRFRFLFKELSKNKVLTASPLEVMELRFTSYFLACSSSENSLSSFLPPNCRFGFPFKGLRLKDGTKVLTFSSLEIMKLHFRSSLLLCSTTKKSTLKIDIQSLYLYIYIYIYILYIYIYQAVA